MARNEIFGPIAAVSRVPDYDAALEAANDSELGLSVCIVTQDAAKINHFSQNSEAGMIQVNPPTAGMDFHAPFTGRKGSSYGAPEKAVTNVNSLPQPRSYTRGEDNDTSTIKGHSHS